MIAEQQPVSPFTPSSTTCTPPIAMLTPAIAEREAGTVSFTLSSTLTAIFLVTVLPSLSTVVMVMVSLPGLALL